MDDTALKPLPYGPGSIAGLILIVGFVLAVAWQAWQQGTAFEVPTRDFLAFVIIISFVLVIAYMFVGKTSEAADILIGALVAAFSAIVAMYFSRGGKGGGE
jgi:predicted neutral ceramidase superfamily lipid hydrolase